MNRDCRQGETELVEGGAKDYVGRKKSETSLENIRESYVVNIEHLSDASDMEATAAAIAIVDKGKRPLRKRRRESVTPETSSQSDMGSAKNIPWGIGFITRGSETSESESSDTFICYYKGYNSADTAVVEDSEDDLFFLEEGMEDDQFPVEYEPPDSESEEEEDEHPSGEHDTSPSQALYEEDPGADGGDEYDGNGDTDSEIDEEDIWTCHACATQNYPITQRCAKCWIHRDDSTQHAHRTSSLPTPHQRPCVPARFPICRSISDNGTSSTPSSSTASSQSKSLHDGRPLSSLDMPQDFPSLPSCSSSDSGFSSHASSDTLRGQSDTNVETPSSTVDGPETLGCCKKEGALAKPVEPYGEMCVVCLTQPRNASFVHGETGHQVCCLSCADKWRATKKKCPVCREKIQMVIKNFF